jgi:nifR3 family TIM-barrel protein
MQGFWKNLKKPASPKLDQGEPIFVLAPLADVTDPAFRRVIAKYGKPDVMWTEFVSADGLARAPEEGRRKLMKDLEYTEAERPIVAQFFTSKPEYMEKAARLALELGFDGVDINMGCPDNGVLKQGAGAALIQNPKLAQEIIAAAKRGAGELPVSVKTRVGFNKVELEEWLPALLKAEPAVITIHARTKKEMSKVPARWEHVKRAVEIRDEFALQHAQGENKCLIFGNGDVLSLDDARKKVRDTGCDGIMLGKAIFGTPWLFANLAHAKRDPQIEHPEQGEGLTRSTEQILGIMVEHTKLFEKLLGDTKNFSIMKKHYKAYVSGWDGATELRAKLMEAQNATEVEEIVNEAIAK